MMILSAHEGWRIERRYGKSGFSSREIFIGPDGVEYIRASAETAELSIEMKTKGVGPLLLKKRSRPFVKGVASDPGEIKSDSLSTEKEGRRSEIRAGEEVGGSSSVQFGEGDSSNCTGRDSDSLG
jgi:hypothetical protein